jgi:Bacterial SH3 domain
MSNSQRWPASRFQIVPLTCTLVLNAGLICAGSIESFAQGPFEIMDPTGTPLNVRASPNGHIVGTLRNGVQVSVLDRAVDRKKQAWVYVGYSEDQSPIGWVYREFIACKSDGTASQGLVGSAHAVEKVHPGDSIGWVKSSDIECEENNTCTLKDNYTTTSKNGGLCAVWSIPIYNRANGTPIAELVSVTIFVVRGEQHNGYTFVSTLPDEHGEIMPYNPKNLNQCG